MEEALAVGVRLVLDDGVSAGIASMRRELAAMDRAMAATSAGAAQVRLMSDGVERSVAAGLRAARQGASLLGHAAPPAVPAEPATPVGTAPVGTPPVGTTPGRAEWPKPETVRAPEPTRDERMAPVVRIFVPAEEPVRPEAPVRTEPRGVGAIAPERPLAIVPPVPAAAMVAPMVPAVPVAAGLAPSRGAVAEAERPVARADGFAPVAPRVSVSAVMNLPAASETMAPVVPALPRAAPPDALPGVMAPASAVAPASVSASAPGGSPPGVAIPERKPDGGPNQGDVFLDGTRVGRWMSDYLAREAGRPQGGSTGFDPRMSPGWPGTLQGV